MMIVNKSETCMETFMDFKSLCSSFLVIVLLINSHCVKHAEYKSATHHVIYCMWYKVSVAIGTHNNH